MTLTASDPARPLQRLGRALADLPGKWHADPLRPDRFPAFAAAARAAMPAAELGEIRSVSMISETTLATLRAIAGRARGAALEIGPYKGGSTLAIAGGLPPGVPLATIEVGGSHLSQPFLPSPDIVGELEQNLARHGVAERVTPIIGKSHDAGVRAAVAAWLGEKRIGLFFMDADQFPARNFLHFARYFERNCLVAIDDYYVEDGSAKGGIVHGFVDRMVAAGALRPAGIVHCTWFGRVAGAAGLKRLAALRRPHFIADQGFGWLADPRLDVAGDYLLLPDGSSPAAPMRLDPSARAALEAATARADPPRPLAIPASPLVILEDGKPLARPHTLHDEIRRLGAGRYSHWTFPGGADRNGASYREVLFATSDNSDPNENGRCYTARAGSIEVPLCGV